MNIDNRRKRIGLEKLINSSYKNTSGIVVLIKGKVVYENYYNGYTASNRIHVFSITKSIISILIGVAIDKGYIKSINEKLLDFFPDYKVKEGETTIQKITIKDIITMTAPYKYKTEDYTEYFKSINWVNSALDELGGRGKIGEFRYTPIIGPDILSGILVKATGESVIDFARKYLFSPLEIKVEGNVVFLNKEEQLLWYKEKNPRGWVADPQGINTAGWGLSLTTMDMGKIGQLFLDEGMWKGKQIISKEWIAESTREQSKWGKLSYGFLWWVIDNKEHIYAAMGDGGNVIYVNPKKNMVVSIASTFIPNAKDRIKLIKEYIEPMFENYL